VIASLRIVAAGRAVTTQALPEILARNPFV
jgi:hypothetical protein